MSILSRLFGHKSRDEQIQDVLQSVDEWAEEHGHKVLSGEEVNRFLDWLIDPSISQEEKMHRFLEED